MFALFLFRNAMGTLGVVDKFDGASQHTRRIWRQIRTESRIENCRDCPTNVDIWIP